MVNVAVLALFDPKVYGCLGEIVTPLLVAVRPRVPVGAWPPVPVTVTVTIHVFPRPLSGAGEKVMLGATFVTWVAEKMTVQTSEDPTYATWSVGVNVTVNSSEFGFGGVAGAVNVNDAAPPTEDFDVPPAPETL